MAVAQEKQVVSSLEIYDITNGIRNTILKEEAHFEAPNWTMDGNFLIINQKGRLFKVAIGDKTKTLLETGSLQNCNNDHGISFDGKWLAISNNDQIGGSFSESSRIYTLPIAGGTRPRLITSERPSYWHGWSPDGKFLLYTAKRNSDYNIFRISIEGGEEEQLTYEEGLDDGPEYSPDGKSIYFNSMASGKMELWRMDKDGAHKEQLTNDTYSNWFPHPSPDGKYLVFISYIKDQGSEHPPMKSVALRLYDIKTKKIVTLCKFIGGQGTINVPSWAPDGKKFAFVSYYEK